MARVRSWRCEVCGYVHEGPEPPESCPVCGVGAELFTPFETIRDEPEGGALAADATAVRIVIVGAGIAGVTAAERAREANPAAEITLVSGEALLPYYRLNLTPYLAGQVERAALEMRAQAFFEERRLAYCEDRVSSIDREASRAHLASGATLTYDRLVLAVGAQPFVPPIPGAGASHVLTLRTLADADAILERAGAGPGVRCVCIGGGLLGLEVAGALAQRGCQVTVLEGAPHLLPRQLPEAGGALLGRRLHEELGLGIRTGVRVEAIEADHVRLGGSGEPIDADFVVMAAGVRPELGLAVACGLDVGRGVLVDDHMVTSDPRILAAGDVAEHAGVVYGIWPAAYAQGAVAGNVAAGGDATFETLAHSTRLKVLGVDVVSIGPVAEADAGGHRIERSSSHSYVRLLVRDETVAGACFVGDVGLSSEVAKAVTEKTPLRELRPLIAALPQDTEQIELEEHARQGEKTMADKGIQGTRTEKNLLAAFAGESQARNRYGYAASKAKKEGYLQIAELFEETADNEKEHAKRFFKFLEGGGVEITATYPAGVIGTTEENLEAAAAGENEEWTELYPAFAQVAREEGFAQVAAAFDMIAKVEKEHEARFRVLLHNVREGKVFRKDEPTRWKCRNCGYVHEGTDAPDLCPACLHDQKYFEVKEANY